MEGEITNSQFAEITSDLDRLRKFSDDKNEKNNTENYCLIEEVKRDKKTGKLIYSSETILDHNYQFVLNTLREKLEKKK